MNKKIRGFKLQPLAEVGFYCGFSERTGLIFARLQTLDR
jgi:hypothetical protein